MLRLQNTSTVSGDQGPLIQFMSANQVGGQNFESGYIQSVWTSEGNAFGMRFATKGVDASQSEKMRITSAGNVGIGTTTPYGRLHLTGIYDGAQNTLNLENNWPNLHSTSLINFWAYYNTTNPQAVIEAGQDSSATNAGVIIFKTMNAGAAPSERIRISPLGNVGINCTSPGQLLTVNGISSFKGHQQHPGGQWYKIPFYLEKGNGVGNTDTKCIVIINNNDQFQELHFTIEYGSRLQGVSDTVTQTSLRSYGVNRFNSGTAAVHDTYLITGGSGCTINTHAPMTVGIVGDCMTVVKVDFSSSIGGSSFVWGEVRIWSIEPLAGKITVANNNY
jgi:hypothetical protein